MGQSRIGTLAQELTGKACPICKEPGKTAFKPFCSRRCADADLLRWLNGSYVIAGSTTDADEDGDDSKAQWDARQGNSQPRSNPSDNDLD